MLVKYDLNFYEFHSKFLKKKACKVQVFNDNSKSTFSSKMRYSWLKGFLFRGKLEAKGIIYIKNLIEGNFTVFGSLGSIHLKSRYFNFII